MSTNPTNAELDAQDKALENQSQDIQKEQEELEKKKQQLESESKKIDENITKEKETLESKTIFEGTKVLEQDRPQREEQEYVPKVKAYDKYNKEIEQFNEKTQTQVDDFNKKAEKFGVEIEGFNVKVDDFNKKVEQRKKEFEQYKIQFQKDYGITYEEYLAKEEKAKKDEAAHQKKLKEYDSQIAELEKQKKEAISKVPTTETKYKVVGSGGGYPQHDGTDITISYEQRKDKAKYKADVNKVVKSYNTKIENLKLDKKFYYQSYDAYQSGVPAYAVNKYVQMYRKSKADFKAALRAGKTITKQAEYYAKSKEAKSAAQAASSILSAQSAAIKASEQYAKDVTAYSSGIQKFDEKKTGDPMIMQNPSAEFAERVANIQPLKVPAGTGGYIPQLTKSTNRPLLVGVKFELIETPIKKTVETIPQKETLRAKSAREISKEISMGLLPTQFIGDIPNLTEKQQEGLRGEFGKPPPTTIRKASPREVAKAISEGKIENTWIADYQALTPEQQEGLRGEFGKPPPEPKQGGLGLVDQNLESLLADIETEQKRIAYKPSEFVYGHTLEASKEVFATVASLKNLFDQYVKTFNIRGEAPPPKSIALKDLAKNFMQRIQFDEPTTREIKIPPTFFTSVSEPLFEGKPEGIVPSVMQYAKERGLTTITGGGSLIIAGTGIEKLGIKAAEKAPKLFAKLKSAVSKPEAVITSEGKIYPNIAKQRELYITKLEAAKPSQSITAQITKAKYEWKKPIDIIIKPVYESPSSITPTALDYGVDAQKGFRRFIQKKVLPKSKAPTQVKTKPSKYDIYNITPPTGSAPVLEKIGTYKPPTIISSEKAVLPKGFKEKEIKIKKQVSLEGIETPPTRTVQPVSFDYGIDVYKGVRRRAYKEFKKGGKAPAKSPKQIGSDYRITPPTGSAPTFERIGTFKPSKIDIPKGVDIPKVISTGRPPTPQKFGYDELVQVTPRKGKTLPKTTLPKSKATIPDLTKPERVKIRLTPPTGVSPLFKRIGTYEPTKQITKFDLLAEKANIEFLKRITPTIEKPLYKENLYGHYEIRFKKSGELDFELLRMSKELKVESKSPLGRFRLRDAEESDYAKTLRHELIHKADITIDEFAVRNIEADPIGLTKALVSGDKPRFIGSEKGIKFIKGKSSFGKKFSEIEDAAKKVQKDLNIPESLTATSTDYSDLTKGFRRFYQRKILKTGKAPTQIKTKPSQFEKLQTIPSGKLAAGRPPTFEKIGTYKPTSTVISIEKAVLPKGYKPKEIAVKKEIRLEGIKEPVIKTREALPKGFAKFTSQKPRYALDVQRLRWGVPTKFKAKRTSSSLLKTSTPRYKIDELPLLPKTGTAPEIKIMTTRIKPKDVELDPLFIMRKYAPKSELYGDKAVPSKFKTTEIKFGTSKYTIQKKGYKSPLEPPKRITPTKKKIDDEIRKDFEAKEKEIKSRSGQVAIVKPVTEIAPKIKYKYKRDEPTPDKIITQAGKVQLPKTGTAPVLFVPKYMEETKKKKPPQPDKEYDRTYYDQVVESVVSQPSMTKTAIGIKAKQTPKIDVKVTPTVSTKIISTTKISSRLESPTRLSERIMTRTVEKQKPRQQARQRITARSPEKIPSKAKQVSAASFKSKPAQVQKQARPLIPPSKQKLIRRAIIAPPPSDRKPKKSKTKRKKIKEYIGNVPITKIVGVYKKRPETIYNIKKIRKIVSSELRKEKTKKQKRVKIF